jgi:hypothetical protein
MRLIVTLLAATAVTATLLTTSAAPCVAQQTVRIRESDHLDTVEIAEILRIGSLDDTATAFGQIWGAAFGPDRSIYVADGYGYHVRHYDAEGRLLRTIGRQGDGPGEFRLPWAVAVDDHHSLVVWDEAQRRFSWFTPEGMPLRTFRAQGHWVVASMRFTPESQLVVGGFGPGDSAAVHLFATDGRLVRSFGRIEVDDAIYPGFIGSLAGGSVDAFGDGFVLAHKSPFRLDFFSTDGRLLTSCVGPEDWTTPMRDAWTTISNGFSLLWDQYVHVSRVFALAGNRVLTVTSDPVRERTILRVVRRDCTLEATAVGPMETFQDRSGEYFLVTTSRGDYPVIVVKRVRMVSGEH